MNLRGKRVLITGASGGIGHALAQVLVREGADVLLTGRNAAALKAAVLALGVAPSRATFIAGDLTDPSFRERLCYAASVWQGGIDMLINNAGIGEFALIEDSGTRFIEDAFATNVIAPIELCRLLLPYLRDRSEAHVVNIGSVFGSIALAGNSVYSATKFALRGFSEALRRELADSNVTVCYYAPRATRTAINSPAVNAANAELGVAMDDPDEVAGQIIRLLIGSRVEGVLGWPEKLFARINAVLPRLVDRAVRKQLPVITRHARQPAGAKQRSVDRPSFTPSRRAG